MRQTELRPRTGVRGNPFECFAKVSWMKSLWPRDLELRAKAKQPSTPHLTDRKLESGNFLSSTLVSTVFWDVLIESFCIKIRYDGIYKIVKYWPEKGKSGFIVWRYFLQRDDPVSPVWTPEGKKRIEQLGLDHVIVSSFHLFYCWNGRLIVFFWFSPQLSL